MCVHVILQYVPVTGNFNFCPVSLWPLCFASQFVGFGLFAYYFYTHIHISLLSNFFIMYVVDPLMSGHVELSLFVTAVQCSTSFKLVFYT